MQAIDKTQREIAVGQSVVKLIFGDMVLLAFIDRKLGWQGREMQKSEQAEPENRPDNGESPVDFPARAEGSFSDDASDKVVIMDADIARKILFFGLSAAAFLFGARPWLGRSMRFEKSCRRVESVGRTFQLGWPQRPQMKKALPDLCIDRSTGEPHRANEHERVIQQYLMSRCSDPDGRQR